jgi:hypothetical protein
VCALTSSEVRLFWQGHCHCTTSQVLFPDKA